MYEQQRWVAKTVVNGVCDFGNGVAIGGLFSIGARVGSKNPILGAVCQACAFVSALFVSSKVSDEIKPDVDKTVDKIIDVIDPEVQPAQPVNFTVIS